MAVYKAVKSSDEQSLTGILGPGADAILHTGDDVADRALIANLIRGYDQMNPVVVEPDGTTTLYIGAQNWPMPIPFVKNNTGAWYFDTEAGKKGTNETDAIDVLHTLVKAQKEYASEPRDGMSVRYALKFLSDEGKHNGLYWKTADNEPPSPIGPLIGSAASEGYTATQGRRIPVHGYYYRILTRQGPAAKGGARDYLSDGLLTRGFAFVAYPAEYRNPGVMTFIVNQDGVVFQKDLGQDTEKLGAEMSEYNPDKTWTPAD